jgi:hypothetical protein
VTRLNAREWLDLVAGLEKTPMMQQAEWIIRDLEAALREIVRLDANGWAKEIARAALAPAEER